VLHHEGIEDHLPSMLQLRYHLAIPRNIPAWTILKVLFIPMKVDHLIDLLQLGDIMQQSWVKHWYESF
jgi:hypothetical protein